MAKKNERRIAYLDFGVYPKANERSFEGVPVNAVPFHGIMNDLKDLVNSKGVSLKRTISGRPKEVYIADIEYRDKADVWVVLVNITDTSIPDEVHRKIGAKLGDVSIHKKDSDTGTDFSCHIVISPSKTGLVHSAKIEVVPGLSSTAVQALFTSAFKAISKDKQDKYSFKSLVNKKDAAGNVIMHKMHYYALITGHVSKEFLHDINNGTLRELTLLSQKPSVLKGIDNVVGGGEAAFKAVALPVDLKQLVRKSGAKTNSNLIRYLRNELGKPVGMEFLKISFDDPGNAPHTVELDVAGGKLIDAEKYLKKAKIDNFKDYESTSVSAIFSGIVDEMLKLPNA